MQPNDIQCLTLSFVHSFTLSEVREHKFHVGQKEKRAKKTFSMLRFVRSLSVIIESLMSKQMRRLYFKAAVCKALDLD